MCPSVATSRCVDPSIIAVLPECLVSHSRADSRLPKCLILALVSSPNLRTCFLAISSHPRDSPAIPVLCSHRFFLQTITVTLALSCDVYNGTTITVSGLTGSGTPDTPDLAVTSSPNDLVALTGEWTQSSGSMVFTVIVPDASTYAAGHWETAANNGAEGEVVLSFVVLQPTVEDTTGLDVTVSGTRTFAPWQWAGGDGKAPHWAAATAPIAEVTMTENGNSSTIASIANGADPFLCVIPVLDNFTISQSNPFAGYENTISVAFSSNIDLLGSDGVTINIFGLANSGISANHAWQAAGTTLTDELGSSDAVYEATNADGDERLTWSIASGSTLLSANVYQWNFTITNPAQTNIPTVSFQILSTKILGDNTPAQILNFTHADTRPQTPLMGVTNGLDALMVVIPFEIAHLDDTVDTPLAPNVLELNITTNIAFVAGDRITIGGVLIDETETAKSVTITTVSNSATSVWGSTAVFNGTSGDIVFTVPTGATMVETTNYLFTISAGIVNPAAGTTVPTITISSSGTADINAITITNSASANDLNTSVTSGDATPFTIVDPEFTSLTFSPGASPGNASDLVFTFKAKDEVSTSRANSGIVTFTLPGFGGGQGASTLPEHGVVSNPADLFEKATFWRLGANSYLQMTMKDGLELGWDDSVEVTVPASMGVKIPADGVYENTWNIDMQVGPRDWSARRIISASTAAVVRLIDAVKINHLSATDGGSVATAPRQNDVYIEIVENSAVSSSIIKPGDVISIRKGNAAWGCYNTRAAAASATRSGNMVLALDENMTHATPTLYGSLNAKTLTVDTVAGTTYTLCYGDELDVATQGVDQETNITIEVQNKVNNVQLNSNGVSKTSVEVPRNDYSLRFFGPGITGDNFVAVVPDSVNCTDGIATANDAEGDAFASGRIQITNNLAIGSTYANFAWADCAPTTTGYPIVMNTTYCPSAGVYRLCFEDGTPIETGISAIVKQAEVTLADARQLGGGTFIPDGPYEGTAMGNQTFGLDFVHTVRHPFEITIQLRDASSNLTCCEGTKVLLTLNKAGADVSANLFNAAGSNATADKIVVADANGVAKFTDYTIRDTAGLHFSFTASVAGHNIMIPEGAAADAGFIVKPYKLTVDAGGPLPDSEAIVGADGTDDAALLNSSIVVTARDHLGNILTGLVTADAFAAEAMLQTGGSGGDSSSNLNVTGIAGAITSTSLEPAAAQNGGTPVVFDGGVATFADLVVKKVVGRYFRLKFTLTQAAGVGGVAVAGESMASGVNTTEAITINTAFTYPGYSNFFKVSPAKMKISYGATPTAYAADTFPVVTRLSGMPAADDAPNKDGLPSVLVVELLDAADAVLSDVNCTGCLTARLVKCDDSVYNNGTTNGDAVDLATVLPLCTGQAINDTEADQMSGMTQAKCATKGGACQASTDFANTLSSNSSLPVGNVADIVNGVATFVGLQAHYTFGSGFSIRFILNADNNTAATVRSVHSGDHGNVFFPDLGAGAGKGGFVAADHTSFVIRPWALEVVQSPGGDGVDIDGVIVNATDNTYGVGDGALNTPDGVGANQPFRVQPAVAVKGMGESGEYYFTESWNNHGHLPVTAAIDSESCGAECAGSDGKGIKLVGGTYTSVSMTAGSATPIVLDGTDVIATYDGDAGSEAVELKYMGIMGKVGFVWKDLSMNMTDDNTGYEGLKLQFVAGSSTNDVQVHVDVNDTAYTKATSGAFDVFVAPDPPVNVRAVPYGSLGFRVEFEPGTIARTKPLSGFIIEVDFCEKSGLADDGSCALQTTPNFAGLGVADRELGSDYYTGGGRTEEVSLSYDPMTGGSATAITLKMKPKEHIYGGDVLQINLNFPGLIQPADFSDMANCVPTGTHADYFVADSVAFAEGTSILTLTVVDGKYIPRESSVDLTLPTACGLIYPETGLAKTSTAVNYGATATGADIALKQASRYGTHDIMPLDYAVAFITGASNATSGDNCKNVTCTVSRTVVLPTVQDSSSMDLGWSGQMQFNATGSACSNLVMAPMNTASPFPMKRFCSNYGTGAADPDRFDSLATNNDNAYILGTGGNSGANGFPIGRNPGRAGRTSFVSAASFKTTGYYSLDSSAACRSGTASGNPCVLPSGEDWATAASLGYTFSGDDNATLSELEVTISRDRYIHPGSGLKIKFPGAYHTDSSVTTSYAIDCAATVDGAPLNNVTCSWANGLGVGGALTVQMPLRTVNPDSAVPPNGLLVVTATGLNVTKAAAAEPYMSTATVAVNSGPSRQRATVIFRNGARAVTYTSADGDPLGVYTGATSNITILPNDIVSFRVYAYNGRFKSAAATTPTQTRAIKPPNAPAYFSEQEHLSVPVTLAYDQPNLTVANSNTTQVMLPSVMTEITITFTTTMDLTNGTTLTLGLPGFTTAGKVPLRGISTGDSVFPTADWNANTSKLVLKLADNAVAPSGTEYTLVIPEATNLLYPATGTPNTTSNAFINVHKLYWVSTFPSKDMPRKGYVVQMTTDRNWLTDIHQVELPDKLNNGIDDRIQIGHLQADITFNETQLTVLDPGSGPALDWLIGKHIAVDTEIMKVTNVTAGTFTVVRGARGSAPVAHTQIKGEGNCACTDAGVSSGTAATGQTCSCTVVYASYAQSTDPAIGKINGFDFQIGTAGRTPAVGVDGCKLGEINWPLGCNILSPAAPYGQGLRTFQTATLTPGMPEAAWLTNCGSKGDTCTGRRCDCSAPTLLPDVDLGNPVKAPSLKVYHRTTGDPLTWSNPSTTLLDVAILDATTEFVVLKDASKVAESYIRIGDELIYVKGQPQRGVRNVKLYQNSGTPDDAATPCSCGPTGNVTGGGTCSCYPTGQMSGCTAAGTLISVGGGGFTASFTIESDYIDSITVTNPGFGFKGIPVIQIGTGGTGCTLANQQQYIAEMSTHVVQVERGALGTVAAAHSALASVSRVTWPLRGTAVTPGPQYHYRIAAYNDAGMSPFTYFTFKIADVSPTELITVGGQKIEVVMQGGGHRAANTRVYVGYLKTDRTIDYARSKPCTSLVVQDIAGTRLTCVTPAWVGGGQSLIVESFSGDFKKVTSQDSTFSFPKPAITAIQPAQVVPKSTFNVTISGINFGTNRSQVVAALITDAGENRCDKIILNSDQQIICTIKPRVGLIHKGTFRVGIGNAWSGRQQNSSLVDKAKIKEFDPPAPVKLTIAKDIATIPPGSPERETFVTAVKGDISKAAGVAENRINVTDIVTGSVVVVFTILPDPNSATSVTPAAAAAAIAQQAADPTSVLLSGSVTSAVTGVAVAASILEAAAAEVGATVSAEAKVPDYFKQSEPLDYTLPNMELCMYTCRLLCETGNEIPSVNGFPALPLERPRICKSQCMTHCGFGRPFVPGM